MGHLTPITTPRLAPRPPLPYCFERFELRTELVSRWQDVAQVMAEQSLSERRACKLLDCIGAAIDMNRSRITTEKSHAGNALIKCKMNHLLGDEDALLNTL